MQESSVKALNDKLELVDAKLYKLIHMRNTLLHELELAKEANAMQERGKMFSDILRKAYTFTDLAMSLLYINQYVLPWKQYLPKKYFPSTFEAIPECLPKEWNLTETSILLFELSEALRRDRAFMYSGRE